MTIKKETLEDLSTHTTNLIYDQIDTN